MQYKEIKVSEATIKQNKMGTLPIGRLLLTMSVPMMLSMLVQALYNVVDSIFVSHISETQYELTAVSAAFPLQNLMIAFGTGIGVGITTLISKSLGEKNPKRANRAAAQGIMLELCSCVIFILIGLFGVRAFMESQTDNAEVINHGVTYLSICSVFSAGLFIQITFEKLLQSTGKMLHSMLAQAIGAILNIILDPIMIFGLFGAPAMGIKGAAIATVIGQFAAAITAIIFHFTANRELNIGIKDFRPHKKLISKILIVGLPSVIMVAIGSVMTYCMNRILFGVEKVGEVAATVFGTYFKLQSFLIMPVLGLNNGMVPIIAFNYGARNKQRIIKTIRLSVISAVCIMLAGFAVFQIAPGILMSLFKAQGEMLDIGIQALQVISYCFIFAGYSIVIASTFQALGNGIFSMIISFVRQLVVLIPTAYLMAIFGKKLWMIWLSFPIAEAVACVLCTFMFIHLYKKLIKPLDETQSKEELLESLEKQLASGKITEKVYAQKKADILDNQ
ncbi:MAG: MATE family efflux transporter [Clostridia bacterium]|nr:MATE family efflux transporter [Clostridia bacterium]